MTAFEQVLKESHGKFCVGDEVSFADAALVPQMFACERFEIPISQWPLAKSISERLN